MKWAETIGEPPPVAFKGPLGAGARSASVSSTVSGISRFTASCDADPDAVADVADVAADAGVESVAVVVVGAEAVGAVDPGALDSVGDEAQALTAPNDATRTAVATDVLMFMVPLLDEHALDHNDVCPGWRLSADVETPRLGDPHSFHPPGFHPPSTFGLKS